MLIGPFAEPHSGAGSDRAPEGELEMAETGIVHVVDDDAGVRESLAQLLGTASLTVGTYASSATFLAALPMSGQGCVLIDVHMPEMNGLSLQRRLAEVGCRLPVIVMTGQGDIPIAVAALKAGAADFLEKPFDDDHLLHAVRTAMAASTRAHDQDAEVAEIVGRLASLTPREREVFDQLVTGQPNKVIGYNLGTSPRTIEVHRARVMEKMAARSLAALVRMSITMRQAERTPA
jgi:two-component system response regulator FixJ